MSGFLAVVTHDGEHVDETWPEQAGDAMAHRGPGDSGSWTDQAVAFVHQHRDVRTRMEGQPLVESDAVVTADLRLDERERLYDRLSLTRPIDRCPDGTLLLSAYRAWGAQCVEHLLGAFAVAIWDRDHETLFCARDHLGIKPFYYADTGELFAAASEPAPLLELPGVTAAPNEHRIGEYLVGRYGRDDESFYEDIERLPPGHCMLVDEDGIDVREYWSVDDVEPMPGDANVDFRERFRELFADAVEARLPEPGPVGSFLSGGLDSSSIASTAARLQTERGNPPLHTFSAVFDEVTSCDEREYIEAVHEHGRFEPHYVRGDRVNPLAGVEDLVERFGGPYYPSLIMLILELYREIGESDVDVVLHGYGGDQVMGSDVRGYLRGLVRRGEIGTLARELRGYADRFPGLSSAEALHRDVLRPLAPSPLRRLRHRFFDDDHYLEATMAELDPEFARASGLLDRLRADGISQPPQSHRELLVHALTSGELAFNLELNDIAAAAHGVEPRYPYLDKRLVEFVVAAPPGVMVEGGLDRALVRDALSDVLPRAVRERDDKMEFSPNVVHTTRTYALDRIERTLFDGPTAVERYTSKRGLRAAFDALQSGGDAADARNLLLATTLERWLRDCAG